jgi:biopolymer transport protein ExbD
MSGGAGAPDEAGGSRSNVFGEPNAVHGVDLNLTALMDILSNLLFFLLASFGATIVMSINGTVPVQSSESDVADKKDQVTVNLNLTRDGVDIAAAGSAQSEEELSAFKRTIPARAGEPDYPAIARQLEAIKKAYPRSDTILLTPEAGVSYAQMIGVMDAAREIKDPAGGAQPSKLFPTVVVSTVVK